MMKKFISLILAAVMLSASFAALAADDVFSRANKTAEVKPALDVTDTKYYKVVSGSPDAEISSPAQAPSNSKIKTTVTVINYGDVSETATLIVAVKKKATGAVYDIAMDSGSVTTSAPVELSAAVTLPNTTDYSYNYYVWDDLSNMISIGNEPPHTPENFKVESVSNSSVTFSWDAAKDDIGAAFYNIYRDGVKIGTADTEEYTDYGLDENTAYSYSISAVDGCGLETAQTASVTAATDNLAVIKMSDLPSDWYEEGMPNATGGDYTGSDGLNVTVVATSANWPVPPAFVEASAFENPGNLEANSYSFGEFFGKKAYASYEMNNGKYGIVFMIPSGSPLRTTDGDNTRSFVFTYYDNGTDPINLRYRYDTGSVWKEITAVTRTDTDTWKTCAVTVTDAVFVANSMHLIFASNTGNGDIYISEVGVCKNYVPKVEEFDAPANLAATGTANSAITLTWDAAVAERSEILGYNIYRDGVKVGETEDTTYTDTGLSEGTTYSYSVTAYSADYESTLSAAVSGTTLAAFAAPTNLAVTTAATTTSTITLTWDAAQTDGITVLGYNIYRDGVKVGEAENTTYTDTGLDDGTGYSYTVTAYSADDESPASLAAEGTTENIATVKMSELPSAWLTSGIASGTTRGSDGLDITGLASTSASLPTFVTREAFNDVESLAVNTYNFGEYYGKTAYASNEMSSGKYGMIFMIPSGSHLRTTDGDNTRTIIFTYYDNGTDPIKLRYRYDNGSSWQEIAAVTRGDSNTWKTCTVTVTDAVFIAHSMHLIFASNTGNGDIYISEVGIAKNYVAKE